MRTKLLEWLQRADSFQIWYGSHLYARRRIYLMHEADNACLATTKVYGAASMQSWGWIKRDLARTLMSPFSEPWEHLESNARACLVSNDWEDIAECIPDEYLGIYRAYCGQQDAVPVDTWVFMASEGKDFQEIADVLDEICPDNLTPTQFSGIISFTKYEAWKSEKRSTHS